MNSRKMVDFGSFEILLAQRGRHDKSMIGMVHNNAKTVIAVNLVTMRFFDETFAELTCLTRALKTVITAILHCITSSELLFFE